MSRSRSRDPSFERRDNSRRKHSKRRLHQLPHVLQGASLGARARQARQQTDDAEQLDVLAAHRERIHRTIRIEARDTGELRRVGQGI